MNIIGPFLAILAISAVPGLAQTYTRAPYLVTLSGSTVSAKMDVRVISRPNIEALTRQGLNPNPVRVSPRTGAFMRIWDGRGTLANLVVTAVPAGNAKAASTPLPTMDVTIVPQQADGSPAPKSVRLGDAQAVTWTLFAENGTFAAESFTFSYDTRQVIATRTSPQE